MIKLGTQAKGNRNSSKTKTKTKIMSIIEISTTIRN